MSKKSGVHVIPKPPTTKAAPAAVTEEWLQKIAPILEGKEPAPNAFVAYLVEQASVARDERTAILANLRQRTEQLSQLKERVGILDGQINARLKDMRAWWGLSPETQMDPKPFLIKQETEADND